VRVNSPIYLSITIKNFFPYNENKRRLDLVDFSCCFFSFLLQDFFTLKGYCVRLLKGKNSTNLFPIFESINLTKQGKNIKHLRQHVPSMEKGLKETASTHYFYASQTQLHKKINQDRDIFGG